VFETYCDPIFHFGGLGDARRIKLVNNLMFAAQISLAAEGLKAVEKMGLPVDDAIEALSLSSGGSFALDVFRGVSVDATLARLAEYLDKDADAARHAARLEGLDLSLLDAAAERWGLGRVD
jgi:3-hydroxyisobutyrate dehydrogenase-like beta-hydroxyacid dehydrogenase